jgi:quinoprotein glucose dehydrogenase
VLPSLVTRTCLRNFPSRVNPTIYRNRIIIGANFFGPGERHIGPQLEEPRGDEGNSRAFDAVTGKKVWEYQTIPQPGQPGHETWGKES